MNVLTFNLDRKHLEILEKQKTYRVRFQSNPDAFMLSGVEIQLKTGKLSKILKNEAIHQHC